MKPFDIRDPLPTGTTVLEASAGTGKTWTIGALVTRFVAEGVATLDQMLIVTFGRAASQELRERVRTQLVEAERALAGDDLGDDADAPSELVELLLHADVETRALRHRRVVAALAGFDAATIATTHQFCSLVLGSLGVAGDTDAHARLVEDLDDLLTEVVSDLYLRAFAYGEGTPAFSHAEALAIARAAVGDPQAVLVPQGADADSRHGRRVAFAEAVRAELDRRKRRLGILSYDDLLSQLAATLAEAPDDGGAAARARMRQRWQVVLVDEFQDTDPVQWQVLDRAFTGHATMVLIGDPKQAIYAFRGGDVVTYLEAAGTAVTQQTLDVNWRSDQPLLAAFQAMLRGAALGDERIVVHDVVARHDGSRLAGAPHPSPFRLRVVRRDQLRRGGSAPLTVGQVRPLVAEDQAHDIHALLAAGATFDGRRLEPQDVAVISYRHADLAAAQAALHAVGIPAVIAGGGSVFATPAAVEWLQLLEGLEQPHRSARVRAAALTSFLGHSATELDDRSEQLTEEVADRLRAWAEVFATRGIAAVLEASTALGLPGRVLGVVGGERHLTDLRHIGEALHEVGLTERLGVASMLAWLRRQVAEGRAGRGTERTRRLDSDAAAVQLVTIHASKGLQYPVVYLPALADRNVPKPSTPLFHDDAGRRCLDVGGGGGDDWGDHVRRWEREEAAEWLRLLYVAVTRAQSQVVAWWAPTRNTPASPLHRMLQGRRPGTAEVPDAFDNRSDDDAAAVFAQWQAAGGPVAEPAVPEPLGADVPLSIPGGLAVRSFDREVDTAWRRTSYSSLTRVEPVAAPTVGSEPEVVPRDDEPFETLASLAPQEPPPVGEPLEEGPVAAVAAPAVPSPMASLPVGADFGSLVHGVLEHADPAAPDHGGDLAAELRSRYDDERVRWPVEVDPVLLVDALVAVCDSPLGSLAGGTTLRQVAMTDRLRELEFELPLAGGDLGLTGEVRLGDLAPLLRRHLPEGDPVRGFADALDRPELGGQSLRGYLTGSVDVVLRVPDGSVGGGGHRYLVVDYKTNWLGPREEPLTAASYAPVALAAAMGHSDYPLQALLYAVVLHRFLRWRQPGYDPERHLGGVLYLYLRGMCGPDTPLVDGEPCGVFAWRPPAALVEDLSALLDGRVAVASPEGPR